MGYRQKCFESKGETCDYCNCEGNLVVHHLDGNRQNNCLDNLVPLCASCHKKAHAGHEHLEKYWEELPPQMVSHKNGRQTTVSIYSPTKDILANHKNPYETWDDFLLRVVEMMNSGGEVIEAKDGDESLEEILDTQRELNEKIDRLPDRIVSELR